jgi:hypothetical protein
MREREAESVGGLKKEARATVNADLCQKNCVTVCTEDDEDMPAYQGEDEPS